MRLCLSCRALSKASVPFCANCGRTFGCRLCDSHHVNPISARYCAQCGKQGLTEPTRYLHLGWLNGLPAWALVLMALRYAVHHTGEIAGLLLAALGWAMAHLLGISPCTVVCALERAVAWVVVIWLISLFLPQQTGKAVRGWLLRLIQLSVGLGYRLLRSIFQIAAYLAQGKPQDAKRQAAKKTKGQK